MVHIVFSRAGRVVASKIITIAIRRGAQPSVGRVVTAASFSFALKHLSLEGLLG
jgi:hypothetical protein